MKFVNGFIPSPEDKRDFVTTAIIPSDQEVPKKVLWNLPVIRDQGPFGSCVGFGTAGLKNIQENEQKDYVDGGLSPLFIYTLCKQQDGIPYVEGTYIRIGMSTLLDYGTSTEKSFPYSLLKQGLVFPAVPNDVKEEAVRYKVKSYASVPLNNLLALKQAMTQSPIVAGVGVYENFFNPEKGFVPKPAGYRAGGHCILFVGYDDELMHTYSNGATKKGFIKFANSWGESWGEKGYGYIAYDDLGYYVNGNPFVYELWSSIDIVMDPVVPPTPPEPPTPTKYYKVQVGAFKVKANCQNFVSIVKDAGFSTYMPPIDADGLYRVQCGAFLVKANADRLKAKLIESGFKDAFIVYK